MIALTNRVDKDRCNPGVSIVVPVFNEEENLEELHRRLISALERNRSDFEILYVDDGSMDSSPALLHRIAKADKRVVIVHFNRNYGQHAAVMAGLEQSRGDVVVTLDADLQNPPEEIPRLLDKIGEGFDVVGTRRKGRQDSSFRRLSSKLINRIMGNVLKAPMRDYGCMLRAYSREIVSHMIRCKEISTFVPALAVRFAARPTEIKVSHEPRKAGLTKYPFRNLLMLMMDLVTGFSMLPMRLMSAFGVIVFLAGTFFGVFLLIRRFIVGPEVEGVFTLFAILFVFIGLNFLALGIIGEYVGRIYAEVRHRPRYLIKEVYSRSDSEPTEEPELVSNRES